MMMRPPLSPRTDPLSPYTTSFRSHPLRRLRAHHAVAPPLRRPDRRPPRPVPVVEGVQQGADIARPESRTRCSTGRATPTPTLPHQGGGGNLCASRRHAPSPLAGEGWGGGCLHGGAIRSTARPILARSLALPRPPAGHRLLNLLYALALGVVGGMAFSPFRMPLPWMLGPMSFCAVAAVLGAPLRGPVHVRPATDRKSTRLNSSH